MSGRGEDPRPISSKPAETIDAKLLHQWVPGRSMTESDLNVLITSPSLDEDDNVSGISTLVGGIAANTACKFTHFRAGSRDRDRKGIGWVLRQLALPFRFAIQIVRSRAGIVHLNTSMVPLAIYRDIVLASVVGLFRRKLIVHVHGGKFLLQETGSAMFERAAGRLLRMGDAVIVLSPSEAAAVAERFGVTNSRVLPNAADADRVPMGADRAGERAILYLGRLDREKGLAEIIEASGILVNEGIRFRFACYGDGPDREWFCSEMKEVLGDSFSYGGVAGGDEKWRVLSDADVFVLPSYAEGLPLALLEAMAAGCIVIASDVGSVGKVIEDGKNGYLIAPKDAEGLASKMKLALSGEFDHEAMRGKARNTVRDRYSFDSYSRNLLTVYREIAG